MKKIREMKIIFPVLCSIVFLLCAGGQAFAATYYVSPTGNDSNSGSAGAPFKTVQKAANIVNPGDTVIAKNGTFTDTDGNGIVVALSRGGTASNWITFKAENKWGAILSGGTVVIDFKAGAKYIRIEDFDITGSSMSALRMGNGVAASNIYFYGNKIHDVARRSISCSASDAHVGHNGAFVSDGSSYITFDSNVIYKIGRTGGCPDNDSDYDHGLYVHSDHTEVINNIFYENTSGWPLQLDGRENTNDWKVLNNTFYGSNSVKDGHIIVWGTCTNVLIQNNISYSPRNYFVHSGTEQSDDSVVIKNNLVYNANVLRTAGGGYTTPNNITGQDPKFVDLAKRDFHLQSGSPAINKGASIAGYEYDAEGNPIVGLPDIGAYEYDSSTTSSPTTSSDTTAPSVPTGLTATAVSSSQINLAWNASTDNVGVSGYKVYRGTTLIATTTTAGFANTGLAAANTYTYSVSAFDAAGNVSSKSASRSTTTMASSGTQVKRKVTVTALGDGTGEALNLALSGAIVKVYKNGALKAQGTTNTSGSYTTLKVIEPGGVTFNITKTGKTFNCGGTGSGTNVPVNDLEPGDVTVACKY